MDKLPAVFDKAPAWLALILPAYGLLCGCGYLFGYWATFGVSFQEFLPLADVAVYSLTGLCFAGVTVPAVVMLAVFVMKRKVARLIAAIVFVAGAVVYLIWIINQPPATPFTRATIEASTGFIFTGGLAHTLFLYLVPERHRSIPLGFALVTVALVPAGSYAIGRFTAADVLSSDEVGRAWVDGVPVGRYIGTLDDYTFILDADENVLVYELADIKLKIAPHGDVPTEPPASSAPATESPPGAP